MTLYLKDLISAIPSAGRNFAIAENSAEPITKANEVPATLANEQLKHQQPIEAKAFHQKKLCASATLREAPNLITRVEQNGNNPAKADGK
jgi:hypothetical protein